MSAPHEILCPGCDGDGAVPSCGCHSCVSGPGCSRSDETEDCERCGGDGTVDCQDDECEVCAGDDTPVGLVGERGRLMPMISALRPVLASGMSAGNSVEGEAIRRFIQAHAPHGIQSAVALETGRSRSRVAEEVEGHKALSLDVALAMGGALSLPDRLRLGAHLLEPWGLSVYATEEPGL